MYDSYWGLGGTTKASFEISTLLFPTAEILTPSLDYVSGPVYPVVILMTTYAKPSAGGSLKGFHDS